MAGLAPAIHRGETTAMPIMFNTILAQAGIEPSVVVLIRHKDHRADKGRTPYELWRDKRPLFEDYQSHQGFAGRKNFKRPRKWASFVGTPEGKTMFVGMYDASYRGVTERDWMNPWVVSRRVV